MPVGRESHCHLALLAALLVCAHCPPASALDVRAGHLVELSIAYGDSHFSSAANLVLDAGGVPEIPQYSLPYAVALLEMGISISRAKAVMSAVLAGQDRRPGSPTRGQFRRYGGSSPYERSATHEVAPLLVRARAKHASRLGDELTQRITAAMELALKAIGREPANARENEKALVRQAALAQLGHALGSPSHVAGAAGAVARWAEEVAREGRVWAPGPSADTQRLLALQRIWEVAPEASRGVLEQALRLCYLDFAQRVHPALGGVSGAAQSACPSEYMEGVGIASYLTYRDFGLGLPRRVTPMAAAIGLIEYRPPAEIVALVRADFKSYTIETNCARDLIPAHTDTYLHPDFTLGTMTGWCLHDSVPIVATFAKNNGRPTAYFRVYGAAAHVSSLQCENLAICSFNFDRIGSTKRPRAWLEGCLGTAQEVEEVYARGAEWNGEPIAIGARDTVVVKRGGVYLAVTLLETGVAGEESSSRRKPGVLEWQGIGEHAALVLTIYARQEDYPLRRLLDDLRAGVVVQIWGEDQFDEAMDLVRWLMTARIRQTYARAVIKTPQPQDTHPVLDKHKPQPKRRYTRRSQKVHTITYAYRRGKGNTFTLVEDLRNEAVLDRAINDQPLSSGAWWKTPAITFVLGQTLEDALAPAPAAEEASASSPTDAQ